MIISVVIGSLGPSSRVSSVMSSIFHWNSKVSNSSLASCLLVSAAGCPGCCDAFGLLANKYQLSWGQFC